MDVAWLTYASDNDVWLVSNGPADASHKLWVQGAFWQPLDITNPVLLVDPAHALFANYLKNPSTYFDPTYPDTITISGITYPKVRSYGLNAYLG